LIVPVSKLPFPQKESVVSPRQAERVGKRIGSTKAAAQRSVRPQHPQPPNTVNHPRVNHRSSVNQLTS
jgi:hypothetical protein